MGCDCRRQSNRAIFGVSNPCSKGAGEGRGAVEVDGVGGSRGGGWENVGEVRGKRLLGEGGCTIFKDMASSGQRSGVSSRTRCFRA